MSSSTSQSWYYDSDKNGSPKKVEAPITSQIPGLSVKLGPEEEKKNFRSDVHESDSSYVKLSKQGGVKDLLNPQPEAQTPTKSTEKSNWFGHHQMSEDEGKQILSKSDWKAPEYMVYEKNGSSDTTGNEKASNGTNEDTSSWARQQCQNNQRKNTISHPPFHTSDYEEIKSEPFHAQRRHTHTRAEKNEDVSFGKLISGGYGGDWFEENKKKTQG